MCSADWEFLKYDTVLLLLLSGGLPLILPSYLCLLWFKGLASESDKSSNFRLVTDDSLEISLQYGAAVTIEKIMFMCDDHVLADSCFYNIPSREEIDIFFKKNVQDQSWENIACHGFTS